MRPVIQSIIDELYARHHPSGRVDLNDIAEIIGPRGVSYEEVDHIVDRLEALGLVVGEPIDANEVSVMKRVLGAARSLRTSLGRNPTIAEIAVSSGHPAHVVRRALERGLSPRVVRSY
ncbi:sigma-70 domain-containing protein [Polyangium sp. y55x31]|nr:sigma-70 domain-containing protein [Polyangium sp. y55x31]